MKNEDVIHEETIAAEEQLPHEIMRAKVEILECRSLEVDVGSGLHNATVKIDGREAYVSAVKFELEAGKRPRATIEFMPKKIVLKWKDEQGRTHVQAIVDNRIVGEWPAERLAGHASLVFDESG